MKTRQEVENMILEKAMKDETFRNALLQTPKQTIEAELGIKLPESLTVRVVEEKPDAFYLVLPAVPVQGDQSELTEAELKMVAAGGNWMDDFANVCESFACCG